jgi:hypothetical protein
MRMRRSSMLRCGVASSEIGMPSVHEKTSAAFGKRSSASFEASAQRGVSCSLRVALWIASSAARLADPAAGGPRQQRHAAGSWSGLR